MKQCHLGWFGLKLPNRAENRLALAEGIRTHLKQSPVSILYENSELLLGDDLGPETKKYLFYLLRKNKVQLNLDFVNNMLKI